MIERQPAETTNRDTREIASRWLTEHGDILYGFAMRRLNCSAAAEDAVQETMAAALTSLDSFREQSTERTWLVGILRHKILHAIRRHSQERAWVESIAAEAGATNEQFDQKLWRRRQTEWRDAPDDQMQSAEFSAVVLRCVDELPPPLRIAFSLRELDGMESSEVCALMGITKTNLWTLIHRAKLKIRDRLSEIWYTDQ